MASTAANPESKLYAYESGTNAIRDFVKSMGWKADGKMMEHMGFTRVEYEEDVLQMRPEIGAVGGKILDRGGRIVGGRMFADGKVCFYGLAPGFTGYLNRAVLYARAEVLDIRCIRVCPEAQSLWKEIVGIAYRENPETGFADVSALSGKPDYVQISKKLAEALTEQGYMLLWDPFRSIEQR